MYREIELRTGIELYDRGENVYILKPTQSGRYALYSMNELFQGCRVLYDVSDEEEKITKKIKIDIPKIQALKKAGWTQKSIAKELNCSVSSVARHWYDKC